METLHSPQTTKTTQASESNDTGQGHDLKALLKKPRKERGARFLYLMGLLLLAVSFTLLLLLENRVLPGSNDTISAVAWINFAIAFFYGIMLLRRLRHIAANHPELLGVSLVINWVSCFTLNESITVFEKAIPWLAWVLVLCLGMWLVLPQAHHLGKYGRRVAWFLFGIAITLFTYYALVLIPIYGYGAIGLILLGLGMHTFFPLITLLYSLRYAWLQKRVYPQAWKFMAAGVATSLLVVAGYCAIWYAKVGQLENTIVQHRLHNPSRLPLWVYLAQHAPNDAMSRQVLKEEVTYRSVNDLFELPEPSLSSRNFDQNFRHNPLMTIAQQFRSLEAISTEERIKVLNAMDGSLRHATEQRLWGGNDLVHTQIETQVTLYPEYRMAYTEKTLEIANHRNEDSWWGTQQEALYTLDLPEGAVVSSLYLWVNGVPRPAYLTTKQKAENAYNTIVGREMRDPSVVHWKEGNQVSLRVFPVTPTMPRKVRIGITSPLAQQEDQLVYEPFTFKGVANGIAMDQLSVTVAKGTEGLSAPEGFQYQNGQYTATAKPWARWSFTVPAPPLSKEPFVYNGKAYQLKAATPIEEAFDLRAVYLDLNKHWTKAELAQVLELYAELPLFAHMGAMERVNGLSPDALIAKARQLNFSLFPFQEITQPENALLITKSGSYSPNWGELKTSTIGKDLKSLLCQKLPIRTYTLSTEQSPYLRTAAEFGIIKATTMTPEAMRPHSFLHMAEQKNEVLIPRAGMLVQELEASATETASQAPDHLFRLYAYGKMLKHSASLLLQNDAVTEENIMLANLANIVSPVSSLVVLETQEDYERFDIEASKGLGNAHANKSGAVPEPEEWLLIILLAFTGIFVAYKTYKKRKLWWQY